MKKTKTDHAESDFTSQKAPVDKWPDIPDATGTIWDVSKELRPMRPAAIAGPTVAKSTDAKRLFEFVKWRTGAVLFFYKTIAEACVACPGISKQISIAEKKLQTLSPHDYCAWRSTPHKSFAGQTPKKWFAGKNLPALEKALALNDEPRELPV